MTISWAPLPWPVVLRAIYLPSFAWRCTYGPSASPPIKTTTDCSIALSLLGALLSSRCSAPPLSVTPSLRPA